MGSRARTGDELPRKGEHVICLKNMKDEKGASQSPTACAACFKVTRGRSTINKGEEISESETQIVGSIAFPEDGIAAREYEMLRTQFGREKTYPQVRRARS